MGQSIDRSDIENQKNENLRQVPEKVNIGPRQPATYRARANAKQSEKNADDGRAEDADHRKPERVEHPGDDDAEIGLTRGIGDQSLADIKPGFLAQKAKPGLGPCCLKIRQDVGNGEKSEAKSKAAATISARLN